MAHTEKTLFQGEVIDCPGGVYLKYTTIAKPMRDAFLEETKQIVGLEALILMREFLCENSYEWMYVLFSRYPKHVVEFSTYSTNWGTLSNFNTVFWEIRLY